MTAASLTKDGDLYGTTSAAGSADYGTVFQLAPDSTETVLHAFAGPPNDGVAPMGAGTLMEIGCYLYGTTYSGCTNGFGTVFRIKE